MGQAKLYGQKSTGMSINGIIESYYAYKGEDIKAGDLVEYINGVSKKTDYGESEATLLGGTYLGYVISAVQLDENRVFVAHSADSSNYYLNGMVITISGNIITKGTDTRIVGTTNAGLTISTCLLPNGNVFIANSAYSNKHLYGIVVKIEGTTIIIDTNNNALSTTDNNRGYEISTQLLPNGNIFIAHGGNGSNHYLYSMIVTISGTAVTKGTDTLLASNSRAGYFISTLLLPSGNVLITHSRETSYYLYGLVCSISGTTITKGTDTQLSTSTNTAFDMSLELLPNNKIFLAHCYTTEYYIYGMLFTVDDMTITKGTDTAIVTSDRDAYRLNTILLPNGDIFIIHNHTSTSFYLYGVICRIINDIINVGTDTQLSNLGYSGYEISSLLLNNGTIFVAHSRTNNTYYLYAQIWAIDYENNIPTNHIIVTEYETQVRKVTTGQFDGIAKTSGKGAPEFVEGEIKKTGNLFGDKTWNKVSMYEYTTDDGSKITINADTEVDCELYKAFDGVSDYTHRCFPKIDGSIDTSPNVLLTYEFTNPTKITKMLLSISASTDHFVSAMIQGSKDNNEWIDLSNVPNTNSKTMYEYSLNNVDYYKYYRLSFHLTIASNQSSGFSIVEWQTSEYIEKGLVPSTGHNEQVEIYTKKETYLPLSVYNDELLSSEITYDTLSEPVTFNSTGYTHNNAPCLLKNGNIFIAYRNTATNQGEFVIIDKDYQIIKQPTIFSNSDCLATTTQLLDNGNVIIAYRDYSTASSVYGYFVIYDQDGNLVKDTTSFATAQSISDISICKLNNSNVALIFTALSSNTRYCYRVVIDQAGNKVQSLTNISTAYQCRYLASCVLLDGTIAVVGLHNDGGVARGIAYGKLSETATEVTKELTSISSIDECYEMDVCTLKNGNIFMVYRDATNSVGRVIIFTPEGSIVKRTLYKNGVADLPKVCLLENGNVLVSYRVSDSSFATGITIFTEDGVEVGINGTTGGVVISSDASTITPRSCLTADNTVCITYGCSTNSTGRFVIFGENHKIYHRDYTVTKVDTTEGRIVSITNTDIEVPSTIISNSINELPFENIINVGDKLHIINDGQKWNLFELE